MLKRLRQFLTPPETKASQTARLIHLESGGRARWTPRDYAALSREGYGKNAIVHRAVRLIAESIGGLTFLLYEGDAEHAQHPLLDLLARPNPRQDGATFLESVTAHLLLAGNAYVEAVTLDGQKGAEVRELYALRPDRVKVVPGPDGWPEAYDYSVGARSLRFTQSGELPPILHLSLFNPLDDHYGLAPIEAAAVAVDTHNAAAKWNKAPIHQSTKGQRMDTQLETKAGMSPGISGDALVTHGELMRAFEAFKDANDERLDEKRADVLLEEKVARIDAALDATSKKLDAISLKGARPAFGRDTVAARSAQELEHKTAFEAYVRAGEASGLRALESKAMSIGSNQDGGYLVPAEVETEIGRRLANISPIRSIAAVRTISSSVYKKPFMTTGPATGWVGETGARTQTASAVLDELSFPAMELYAMPAATANLLEDAAVNIDQWIAAEVEQAFAEQEGAAFVSGDGDNKPTGFLHSTMIAESSWTWGKLGFVISGADGAFPEDNPSDPLIDLVYALKAGYRQNGMFVMNRKTQSAIRKLKDADDNYLWTPPAQAGGRAALMSFPVIEAEDMPDIAADSFSVAFGDFNRGYLIVDRAGVSVLRDPYTAKPYVLFYTTKRVGGGVQDFDAIKLLKFADA